MPMPGPAPLPGPLPGPLPPPLNPGPISANTWLLVGSNLLLLLLENFLSWLGHKFGERKRKEQEEARFAALEQEVAAANTTAAKAVAAAASDATAAARDAAASAALLLRLPVRLRPSPLNLWRRSWARSRELRRTRLC
ncbi:hypothetical protein F4778DRAFT_784244 [Xylariomycetidae sp. FL2044]|nr:hypothetical protein F4778DRAFT_784244 [Xylariomycetidae sp. FL2044]